MNRISNKIIYGETLEKCDICECVWRYKWWKYEGDTNIQGYIGMDKTYLAELAKLNINGLKNALALECPKGLMNPYLGINWTSEGFSAWRRHYGSHPNYIEHETRLQNQYNEEWKKKPLLIRLFTSPKQVVKDY